MGKRSGYQEESALAGRAAVTAGLGEHVHGYVNRGPGFGGDRDKGYVVCEFTGGLVGVDVKTGIAEPFPWGRMVTVTQRERAFRRNGSYTHSRFGYKVTRDDGVVMELTSGWQDPQYTSKRPDPQGVRYHALCLDVSRRVCAQQLPVARAALARGETVTFGRFVFGREQGVRTRAAGGRFIPWQEVGALRIRHEALSLQYGNPRRAISGGHVMFIPNLPVLLTLLEQDFGVRVDAK